MTDETFDPELGALIHRLDEAFDDQHLDPIPSRLSSAEALKPCGGLAAGRTFAALACPPSMQPLPGRP